MQFLMFLQHCSWGFHSSSIVWNIISQNKMSTILNFMGQLVTGKDCSRTHQPLKDTVLPQKVSYPNSGKRFFTCPKRPEHLWTNPTSYSKWTDVFPLEVQWLGYKSDLSPPSCAEAKNTWNYTSTSICFHGMYKDNFTFTFHKTNFTAFQNIWYNTQYCKKWQMYKPYSRYLPDCYLVKLEAYWLLRPAGAVDGK
jgi:hypothetical protein